MKIYVKIYNVLCAIQTCKSKQIKRLVEYVFMILKGIVSKIINLYYFLSLVNESSYQYDSETIPK